MTVPRAPVMVRRSAAARRAWRELWRLLDEHDMAAEVYAPTVAVLAAHMGIADEAAEAVFRPINPLTGKREKRSLEEYLVGRNSQTSQELTVLRDSLRQVVKVAAEFGMSPAAQARIGADSGSDEPSPMMQYIKAMNERMKNRRVS